MLDPVDQTGFGNFRFWKLQVLVTFQVLKKSGFGHVSNLSVRAPWANHRLTI